MNTLSTPPLNSATTFLNPGPGPVTRVSLGPLPHRLAAAASALGPIPRASLSALVDLGLSTQEIADYLCLDHGIVAELLALWCVARPPSLRVDHPAPHLA